MNRLDTDNSLFVKLEMDKPSWWQNLISDPKIYIEVRKDNSIDIYYNGGNIITGLKFNNKKLSGQIHYKYLLPNKAEYIKFNFENQNDVSLFKNHIDLIKIDSLDEKYLKIIKQNIQTYYPSNSEKGIQAKFITEIGEFIDSEFAYKVNNDLRIDLIMLDLKLCKIVPVELKIMGDNRLYSDEIKEQLFKYYDFFEKHEDMILKYYQKIFSIKKKLGILPVKLQSMDNIENFRIEKRPLLVIGNCTNEWIKDNHETLDNRIKSVAYGTYYFGKVNNCQLLHKSSGHRHIYI